MKVLFIECNMGVAGDMLLSGLLEVLGDAEKYLKKLNQLGIPKVKYVQEKKTKCGIVGTHVSVLVNGSEEISHDVKHHHGEKELEHTHGTHTHGRHTHGTHTHEAHHHATMQEIETIIDSLQMTEEEKEDMKNIYRSIAQAESMAHGQSVSEIHFHEVGTLDAIADIAGCVTLIRACNADEIIASPVATGYGMVRCAHGILPVPAPATNYLLQGIPCYAGSIEGELCTPTGAAILKYFVNQFSERPCMVAEKTGYGMGTKDFEAANCIRVILGQKG